MSGAKDQEPDATPVALLRTRALANPLTPMLTAPLSVERVPTASGGLPALTVAINDTMRKLGLVRGLRLLAQANQPDGFACPGCAWPEPTTPTRWAVCESGVRAIVDNFGERTAGPQLFATYTIPELSRRSDHWLASQGRLTTPMIRRADANGYAPISWDEALALVAASLRELSQPDRAVFYASARVSNEAAFLLQLLARSCGTNNLMSSSQLCHAGSRVAMQSVLGCTRSPIELADFDAAEAIFVFGLNPGSNHPRMLDSLRAAKQRGAKIVAINPLRELGLVRVRDPKRAREWFGAGQDIADLSLRVRVAGDLALLAGLCKATIEADAIDHEFIAAHTEGFAALAEQLAARSWADITAQSGLDEAEIRAAADIYMRSRATIACWGVGLTQHRHGVETIEALLSWLLLRGNVGKVGAGPLAVLGHANTAGCWTMGVDPNPSAAWLDALAHTTGIEPPRAPGLGFGDALAAMRRGEVDVLLSLGGNLLSAAPDTEAAADSLRRCKLTVHLATKLNRAHLITGETGLLLPVLARGERELGIDGPQASSFEDATGGVRLSCGRAAPIADELLSEVEILARIGAAAWPQARVEWPTLARDHQRIRTLIASLPECEGFAALAPGSPLRLPSPARTRRFTHPSGKAALRVADSPVAPLPDGALWLTTVRSHDQHNSTVYSVGDRERGLIGYRRVLLMNLDDMRRLDIEPYTQVDLTSVFDHDTRHAPRWVAIPHHVRAGCVAAYWPEANVLVPARAIDPRSGTPGYKSIGVTIAPSG